MEIENKVSFEEWKKNNPSGSLNEFYIYLRKNNIKIKEEKTVREIDINSNNNGIDDKNSMVNLFIGIFASILGLIGYFTPWFSDPIFHFGISGNEINQLSNIVDKYGKENVQLREPNLLKYTFIIPVSYLIICLGTIVKSYLITLISSLINIFSVGLLVGAILYNVPEFFDWITFGLYAIFLSWILLIYNLFTIKY